MKNSPCLFYSDTNPFPKKKKVNIRQNLFKYEPINHH